MKLCFLLLTALVGTTTAMAQSSDLEYTATPEFIASKYNKAPAGTLRAHARAKIFLGTSSQPLGGKDPSAALTIQTDSDSTYDGSCKIYAARFDRCAVTYTTYALADALRLVIDGKEYALSCIDGGMDVHIRHLSHQYRSTKRGERLKIEVLEDLLLTAADRQTVVLKKGSRFEFEVME